VRILISGATGFVGGHLVRHFATIKGTRPSLFLTATGRRPAISPELAGFADDYIAADLAVGCPPIAATVCVHAAGLADDRSTAPELHRANVDATRNLIEALQGCRLFVFISSASVYGPNSGALCEVDATADSAISDYGRSKWASEQTVREVCGRRAIPHVILRPRAVYGIGDRVLLPRLVRLVRPPWLFVIGGGAVALSLTYIGHLTSLVTTLVLREEPLCDDVFNVADAAVYPLQRVLSALYQAIHHKPPHIVHIPVALVELYLGLNELAGRKALLSRQSLGYLTQSCVLNCTRARDVLGYAPSTTLFDHIEAIGREVSARSGITRPLRGGNRH
jgi:nucleoside-diphosphate-sugar epimerase